jgi:hypothetical protein
MHLVLRVKTLAGEVMSPFHLIPRSLTESHSPSLSVVPPKIQKGFGNTKALKGTTITLTAQIMGEPVTNNGWCKDGEDIEEDDRQGPGPVERAGPGV